MPKVYEISEWVPRWVKEHCLVEAENEEEAIEAYHNGHILDWVSERDEVSDRVDGRDSYGLEVCEEVEAPHSS